MGEFDQAANEAKVLYSCESCINCVPFLQENVRQAQAKLDDFLKKLREHDKDMREKQATVEDLKKAVQQINARKENIARESIEYEKKIEEYTKRVRIQTDYYNQKF